MKKLLTLLLVLVCSVGFAAGTTTEDKSGVDIIVKNASLTAGLQTGTVGTCTAPIIKYAYYAGTTNAAEGGETVIAHGLTASNILSITAKVYRGLNNACILPNDLTAGWQYSVYLYDGAIHVANHATNSEGILGLDFSIIIAYRP